ncbi:hypothetical protein Tco_0770738 [Tanacetum coccineum]|uniref:Uncharacterized protein n=1 Tax=Tanacetum coccineum TaxID=301880 RepID=A0ABQ4ZFY9_9ASTR
MGPYFILDKLGEVAESSRLPDKMKVVFNQEGLKEHRDVVRAFENIKEIIAHDSMMLGDLEQLLAHAQVGVCLKDGYLADVEEKVFGINKWYQSFTLRNFDLEDMELESTNSGPTTNLPILKLVPQTTQENGTSVTKMFIHVTAEEKTNKKNDVKARVLLLMALPNEHQLIFSQYPDAKSMFDAIVTRFRGNAATKKTQKTLLKQYLPPEWNTHVVKKTVGTSSGGQNLAFITAPRTSSTNDANTTSPQVSAASPSVNADSPQVCTASVSDKTMYAFMVENPNGSNVLHQDLEQIYEDDLEAMDLNWQLSLLSVSFCLFLVI